MPDRIVRSRIDSFTAGVDRAGGHLRCGCPGRLVQVYDGGGIPTTVPAYFLTHPVRLTGTEAEGDAPTVTADAEESIPVYVLGPEVPAVGDLLLVHAVGGRWVARTGGGGGDEEPACGESCGTLCDGDFYSMPGTITTTNGTVSIGQLPTFNLFGLFHAYPPATGLYDTGIDRWVFNDDLDCYEVSGTSKYFYGIRCEDNAILVSIYTDVLEYNSGFEDCESCDVDPDCGYCWPSGTLYDAAQSTLQAGLFFRALEVEATVDSCGGGTITLDFDLGDLRTCADDPPLVGTITLTKVNGDTFGHACCTTCNLPSTTLVLTIGAEEISLLFFGATTHWAGTSVLDQDYTLVCGADGPMLMGGGDEWTFDAGESTCDPLHLVFTRDVGDPAYVDEP